jgi:hypothetical protein
MSEKRVYPEPVLQALSQAFAAFDELERLMGPKVARICWEKIEQQSRKKHGRPKGSSKPLADAVLLKAYDTVKDLPVPPKEIVSKIAQLAHKSQKGKFSATEEGVRKKLHRLIDERIKRREQNIRDLAASLGRKEIAPN